eukprot:TRINITY_DN11787_c0_g1_i4.p1 TRINITY_DN11787_c0_g1~~TRINITY_DN11787_c0_g1_i4.p1  ORF type:complete len:750 (+),score=157.34 TRINITY_DN11787_c0_g1_i4:97-2346(+)
MTQPSAEAAKNIAAAGLDVDDIHVVVGRDGIHSVVELDKRGNVHTLPIHSTKDPDVFEVGSASNQTDSTPVSHSSSAPAPATLPPANDSSNAQLAQAPSPLGLPARKELEDMASEERKALLEGSTHTQAYLSVQMAESPDVPGSAPASLSRPPGSNSATSLPRPTRPKLVSKMRPILSSGHTPDSGSVSTYRTRSYSLDDETAPDPRRPRLRKRMSRTELNDVYDMTGVQAAPSPRSRRERLLKAAGNQPDFGKQNLYRLFRLFDMDNDGQLTHGEFQSGLVAMGLDVAQDPFAVGRLLKTVDQDNTGAIGEDEFVHFFKQLRTDDIERRLKTFAEHDPVTVDVVTYTAIPNPDKQSHFQDNMTVHDFAAWLRDRQARFRTDKTEFKDRKDWVVIKGYDRNVSELLTVTLDIHEEILEDVITIQRDKLETFQSSDGVHAHLLLSVYTMAERPIADASSNGASADYEEEDASVDRSHNLEQLLQASTVPSLVTKRILDTNPPTIRSYPVSVIVVDDSLMLVVLREPDVSANPITIAIDELKDQIARGFPDVILGGTKYLAYLFLEAVSELNYNLRDVLKQWLELIDDGISQSPSSRHRAHLFEFSKISSSYTREMSALANRLTSLDWNSRTDELVLFFKHQAIYFQDLNDQLVTILDEADQWSDTVANLFQLYRSVQDEQTNRVLLLLTLVTTIFIPMQFLTGLWGMNFEDMPELRWRYGYEMFWGLAVALSLCVALWFRTSGFWRLSSL